MRTRSHSHFTIIEILVVIAVIAILMGSILGITDYVSRKNGEARTLAVVEMLRSGLEQYKEKYGFYPPTKVDSGIVYKRFHLDKLTTNGVSDNFNQFIDYNHFTQSGKSKKEGDFYYILDGFGGYIYYRCPGHVNKTAYDLGSLGSDGKGGDNTAAVDSNGDPSSQSDFNTHFGKGDDITNCRR